MSDTPQTPQETRFHWLFRGIKDGPTPYFDCDLSDDESVAILPSKGSLVPGWLLAIPRVKALSLSVLSEIERRTVLNAVQNASHRINVFAEATFIFEHGPCLQGSLVGCGVDQAHLHIVPLNFNLVSLCLDANEGMIWHEVNPDDPWRNLLKNRNYYLLSDMKRTYVAYPENQYSQYFRRKIALGLGKPEEWDYKLYPNEENAKLTIERFNDTKYKRQAA